MSNQIQTDTLVEYASGLNMKFVMSLFACMALIIVILEGIEDESWKDFHVHVLYITTLKCKENVLGVSHILILSTFWEAA